MVIPSLENGSGAQNKLIQKQAVLRFTDFRMQVESW